MISGTPSGAGTADYSVMANAEGFINKLTAQGTLAGSTINHIKQGEEFLYTPSGGAPVEPFTADGEFTEELKGKRFERGLNLVANVTVTGAGSVRLFFTVFMAKAVPCS
ncbi:MAG: hypothetical protein IPI35_35480 [Deltaproteobacteria bacterium]|nr:hypothetical protein [Deltaproteobacteria bacterium]